MPQINPLLGSYGKILFNGAEWMGVSKVQADMELAFEDYKTSGSLATGKKYAGYEINGSMTCYKLSSDASKSFEVYQDPRVQPPIYEDVLYVLDDPAGEVVAYRLTNLQFTKIPLFNSEVGALVEDEYEFTVEKYEALNAADMGITR